MRRQQAKRIRNIEHAQHVKENRPVSVRGRWIDDDDLIESSFQQRRISREHSGMSPADDVPLDASSAVAARRALRCSQNIRQPAAIDRLTKQSQGALNVVGRGVCPTHRPGPARRYLEHGGITGDFRQPVRFRIKRFLFVQDDQPASGRPSAFRGGKIFPRNRNSRFVHDHARIGLAAQFERRFRRELFRQTAERNTPELLQLLLAPGSILVRRFGRRIGGEWNEHFVDSCVQFVTGQRIRKGPQLPGVDRRQIRLGHGTVICLEVAVDPAVGHETKLRLVVVSTRSDANIEEAIRAIRVEAVEAFEPGANAIVSAHGKNGVVPGIFEQERPRRNQRGDVRPGPLKGIDQEHAVAMAVDDLVAHIILQVAHPTGRHGHFDAFVRCSDPE